ncbi:unnamed protein product [Phytophthora lilii]|uniref:endo-polygalacturonase n=1 Tax=Phytophthora lilii TaxID=2077276 RepID=A0A9W7CJW9_9STRA|nr:unnamed protein product [Phytophthora lilii]
MQSSTNTVFSNNYCSGGHGISIGSLGGDEQNASTTVAGLLVKDNMIVNSDNGIRIKTIVGLKGLVTDASYIDNKLVNVKNAIVVHSDYNKTKQGYSGVPTSVVPIINIKIDGLSGSATNLYDIVANPDVMSHWSLASIAVNATNVGQCKGSPTALVPPPPRIDPKMEAQRLESSACVDHKNIIQCTGVHSQYEVLLYFWCTPSERVRPRDSVNSAWHGTYLLMALLANSPRSGVGLLVDSCSAFSLSYPREIINDVPSPMIPFDPVDSFLNLLAPRHKTSSQNHVMKLFTPTLVLLALLLAAVDADDVVTQNQVTQESQASQVGQVSPASQMAQDSPDQEQQSSGCTLTGNYTEGTDVSQCSTIVIDSLSVPAGVMLDLTNVSDGASIKFEGMTTFGPKLWDGPLVKLKGNSLTVTGPGTLDGQGAWYWPQGQKVTRPVFFRLSKVANSTLSGFSIKNMPYRTFSILSSNYTTISGLTIDSRAGNGSAKNTDGFDLSRNDHVTITGNRVYNQDDCLAMQSSTNTIFSNNYCSGSHGISIGSLGGPEQNINTTVAGLLGLVTNVTYSNNKLVNVKHAIVMHSDYNKTRGGYSGIPTSLVNITNIKIEGLSGSAKNLYNIVANPDVVSNWSFINIAVNATNIGQCKGGPSNVQC